jgi:hypothetical protein
MKKVKLFKCQVIMTNYCGWVAVFVGEPTKNDVLRAHRSEVGPIEVNSPNEMMQQFIDLYWKEEKGEAACRHLGIEIGQLYLSEEGRAWVSD